MKVFITGASGFIGGAVATRLRAAGHDVVALSRSDGSDKKIQALGATPCRGELGAVDPAILRGCEIVIHCAAYVEAWGTFDQYWRANVDGTTQLLEAAKAAGASRFIHIGTEAALFRGQHMRDIDEKTPYPKSTPFYYSRTKAEAERRVLAANDPQAGFQTISIRPRMVWGPGDQTVLPEALAMIERGAFAWIDGGARRTSTTHVDNLVHGVMLLLDKGRGGESYFVTDDEIVSYRDFLGRLIATQGVATPDRSLPGFVLRGAAYALETIWRTFGLKSAPPITRFAVALISRDCTIKIDKAKNELGYAPVISVDDGMAAMPKL
jgi:hypothetical protein